MVMAIEQFLIYLHHEKRYSPHTVQSYRTDLLQFKDYLHITYEISLLDAMNIHLRDYMVWLMDQGNRERSVARKLSVLRSFYKFGVKDKLIESNPALQIRSPKLPKRLPVYVESEKLIGLLDSPDFFDESFSSVRDKLILETLFGTGIRLSELISLKYADIDFYGSSIKVMGKGGKERIVPIMKSLVNQLKAYEGLKSLQNFNNKTGCLFVTDKGTDVYPKLIYKIVNHYLSFISTQDKKSPHVLRHSYATALLNKGADLNAIKELLGHASLAATQVYTHNSVERLKSIYKQAHPKA